MDVKLQNYRLETDKNNILWVTINRQDSSVNTLNQEMFIELDQLIHYVYEKKPKGVIFQSGKTKGFIAGADIKQFTALKTAAQAYELIRPAQLILNRLADLPVPTVAMMKGFALGGGLEFALACDYRVVDESDDTYFGLPEIKLGIHPGWGGTIRLVRLIGVVPAMQAILTGKTYPAKKAARLGIVDIAVPTRQLKKAATAYIMRSPALGAPKGTVNKIIDKISQVAIGRTSLGKLFYKNLASKHVNKEHYPAPYAVVANWIRDGAKGEIAMDNEAKSIADLMVTNTAHNLVKIFFLQDRLKGLAKSVKYKPQYLHVIGAGTMGGDIAAFCVSQGMYVTLQDQAEDRIASALSRARQLFEKKWHHPRLVQAAMDRLQPMDETGVMRADIIIEAIFEDLSIKQELFKKIEALAKPHAILATNTSSIPLEEIAQVLKEPSRLIGIHFFNPVAKMPLIEVVKSKITQPEIIEHATAFVTRIGRLPLPVMSSPGFLVNRILMPYLMEAMQLYEEGISAQAIDAAALRFGMPMGPITLADAVGLDICYHVAENLSGHFGGSVPVRLKNMMAQGHLGVKSGQGFYLYNKGKKVNAKVEEKNTDALDICERLIARLLNEAVACLQEKVVEDQDLLDAGMIFGTGFAPFRGGPMHYIQTLGAAKVVKDLHRLVRQYGERFKPHSGWQLLGVSKAQIAKDNIVSSTSTMINSLDE